MTHERDKARYLSSTPRFGDNVDVFGLILTTSAAKNHGIPARLQNECIYWCLDNGVFTEKFTVDAWADKIESLDIIRERCLFIVVPDVIGDSSATIRAFHKYKSFAAGWPLAFVSQDGIKKHATQVPWDDFEVLFVGGSDAHKLGREGGWIIREAQRRGKRVHVGRVNSTARILRFYMANSWDGTHLNYMPSDASAFAAAVRLARIMQNTKRLL